MKDPTIKFLIAVILLLGGIFMISIYLTFNGNKNEVSNLDSKFASNLEMNNNNISDITVVDSDGNIVPLSQYKGKVLLIVNVASRCGFTSQYEGLQRIYDEYKKYGFEILAFPCNQFGNQEPGSMDDIKQFCSSNYNITFKLFDKIDVNGNNQIDLYSRLTNNDVTGTGDVKWNFEKFLISRSGDIKARFGSSTEPESRELIDAIKKELN